MRQQAVLHATGEAPERFGQYLLYEPLGHGAMASVRRGVLCREAGFRRVVALKRLHPHLAEIPEMVEQFAHEARLGSYLRHANLAQTFDFGNVNGAYFIAMELVRGPTLAQLARQCAGAAGPIPMGIVLGILSQLCDAFDYIRNARDPLGQPLRLAHCDVSPTNILISNTGYVKLIDFGIARAGARPVAETGMLRRRLAYVAPEYAHGTLDARSDLFSLGVIGYELIANQPLFAGSGDELRRVREMPIPPLVRGGPVPHALQDVIMTALQRDPERRWQSAAEMRSALSDVARGMAVHIGPPQIASWVAWAFSQRLRPDALTPLVVVPAAVPAVVPAAAPAVARSTASPAVVAAMAATSSIRPGGRAKPVRRPSSNPLPFSGFTRELTRRFQRSRRRPTAGVAIGEPLRRTFAHTVPRGLRKADRLRGTPGAGSERSGPVRQRSAGAERSGPVRQRSAAAPVAASRVASLPVRSSPRVAPPEPPRSLSTARADAASSISEPMRPAGIARSPGEPRAGVGRSIAPPEIVRPPGEPRAVATRPTALPHEPATPATGAARNASDTTGVVVVPASRRPGGAASGRERKRNTRVIRLRRLPRSVLPVVLAILAALVAFALAYRWLHL